MLRSSVLMTMAKRCPVCSLYNPESAQRCDCGWDFAEERVERSYANPRDPENVAERGMTLAEVGARNMKRGAGAVLGGVAGLTFLFYSVNVENSGIGVFHGLWMLAAVIAGGVGLLIRGLRQRSK